MEWDSLWEWDKNEVIMGMRMERTLLGMGIADIHMGTDSHRQL